MKLLINNRIEHLNAMNLNRVPAYCLYVAVMVMLCRNTIYIAPTYIIANLYACSNGKLPVGENKRIVIFPSYHCSSSGGESMLHFLRAKI